jgi:hypothetical protein
VFLVGPPTVVDICEVARTIVILPFLTIISGGYLVFVSVRSAALDRSPIAAIDCSNLLRVHMLVDILVIEILLAAWFLLQIILITWIKVLRTGPLMYDGIVANG